MRQSRRCTVPVILALLLIPLLACSQEADRKVQGGGISAPGWQGKADRRGSTADSKFTAEGNALHIATGPASVYWNPADTAQGDYTVKATFREPKQTYGHPHPFGLFIGGSKLDTDQPSLLYCVAYRNGTYLVRLFSGGRVATLADEESNPAVKSAGPDQPVVQEISWTVKGGRAECRINGAVVAGYDRSQIVGPGKLDSTDGVAGIRVAHNVDIMVTGFGISK